MRKWIKIIIATVVTIAMVEAMVILCEIIGGRVFDASLLWEVTCLMGLALCVTGLFALVVYLFIYWIYNEDWDVK